jgi:hypothetical protein
MTDSTFSEYNKHPLNQQAMRILETHQIRASHGHEPFNPKTELASLVLIQEALERNLLDTGEIEEPELLIAKLAANPELAMTLMTESEPGVEFSLELPESLEEAAAVILEEIVASLKALPPTALQ